MLKSLRIENIAVIENAVIEFSNGFNVLTGETGAGKSIIIDSINAVLGLRTSKDLVRTGAKNASVTAEFTNISKAALDKLFSFDINDECGGVILRRSIGADGKSSCRINGVPCTAAQMRELTSLLINIHGQHDNQELLNRDRHIYFIDKMLDNDKVLGDYILAYKELCFVIKQMRALDTDDSEKERRRELLLYEIDELEKAEIKPGEKADLVKRRDFLHKISDITRALQFISNAISGNDDEDGTLQILKFCLAKLDSLAESDEDLESINGRLSELIYNLEDISDAVKHKILSLDIDKNEIDSVEQRLDMYYDFSKYGSTEEDMLAYLENAKSELESINLNDKKRTELERDFEDKKVKAYELARKLSELRKKAAVDLEKSVEKELHFLDMPDARFEVRFQSGPMCKTGVEKAEFYISVNAGEPLKPLADVASGGELSRIMLALRSVIGKKEDTTTLIFDEIDTGISGRAAQKVGIKLKNLGNRVQVICVTHLAQIAALADNHFLIRKQVADGRTYTNVESLSFEGRKYEIARIIGGSNISELTLKNAEEMLKGDIK